MAVQIVYGSDGRGNTVPYPPLYDEIRQNHGFVDLRGKPDEVAAVPEAQESLALADLLITLAQPHSTLISLGCDLGEHTDPGSQLQTRRRAGGYVQVADARMNDAEGNFLKSAAAHIEAALRAAVGNDRWSVRFDLARVAYAFDDHIEAHSLWIWFDAKASTIEKARLSRERILTAMTAAIETFGSKSSAAKSGLAVIPL